MSPFPTISAIRAIELIGACGVVVSSVEWMTNARHLRDDALLGWPVSRLRHASLTDGPAATVLDAVCRYPTVLGLIAVRLIAALLLVAGSLDGAARATTTALVAIITIVIAMRSPFGLDGADQMAAFVFVTLALARIVPQAAVEKTFLWVVALQSCLAYLTAGFAKAVSPIWRSGSAIPGIASTRMYGARTAARMLRAYPWIAVALAWSIIVTECLFPIVLIAPTPIAVALFIGGAAFHILSGVFMGLNTFIWSFFSTYPAILWCRSQMT
jgi:hypothetical protein